MSAWTVKVVQQDGTVLATLVDANVQQITEKVNDFPQAVFTMPKIDPPTAIGQAAAVQSLGNEVQIWRTGDSAPIFWGIPVGISTASSQGYITVTANGLAWHFTRRAIDKVLNNFLNNPDFESGIASWAAVGVTTSVVSTPTIKGVAAAQLNQANTWEDTYLHQVVTVTGTTIGTLMTVTAWFFLDAASYRGAAYENRGLYIEGRDHASGAFQTASVTTINDTTPRGDWQRHTTTIWIPPSATWDLDVRLYAPAGVITWDATELVEMESLGAFGETISQLACAAIAFIQDTDKGSLSIATDASAGGPVIASKWWQFADHTMADQAIAEWVGADPGFDWDVVLTGATRTFRPFYPRQGTDLSATVTLKFVAGATDNNLSGYAYTDDGTPVETDETVLGEGGGGPDREVGHARDLTAVATVYQGIYPCTPGSTVDQLDPQALGRLNAAKRVVKLPVVTCIQKLSDLIGTVHKGDVVTLHIADGWVQINAAYRVVGRQINPANNTMALTLNEE